MKRTLGAMLVAVIALVISACKTTGAAAPTAEPAKPTTPAIALKPTPTPAPIVVLQATPTTAPTAVPTATTKPAPTATTTTSGTDDPFAFLQQLASDKPKTGDYRITYDLTAQDQNARFVYFRKGAQTRTDTIATGTNGAADQTTRLYMNDDEVVSCTEDPPNNWTCLKLTDDLAKMAANLSTLLIEAPQQLLNEALNQGEKPAQQPSRKIAGQDAQVFLFQAPEGEQGEVEFAFSNDGILLLIDVRGMGETDVKLEAIEYSKQVADSDFVPPATPL